jgi:hypothetical protein
MECCGDRGECRCGDQDERKVCYACYVARRVEQERRGDEVMADHPELTIDDLRDAVSRGAACAGRHLAPASERSDRSR